MVIINALYFSDSQTNNFSRQAKRKGGSGEGFLLASWLLLTEVHRNL